MSDGTPWLAPALGSARRPAAPLAWRGAARTAPRPGAGACRAGREDGRRRYCAHGRHARAARRDPPGVQDQRRRRPGERRVGDRVQKGQRLASLKRTEVSAAVEQASASLEKARRDLDRATAAADRRGRDRGAGRGPDDRLARRARQSRAARFNERFAHIEAPADGVVLQRLIEPRRAGAGWPARARDRRDRHRLGGTGRARRPRRGARRRQATRRWSSSTPSRAAASRAASARIAAVADPQTGTFEAEIDVDPQGVRVRARTGGEGRAHARRRLAPPPRAPWSPSPRWSRRTALGHGLRARGTGGRRPSAADRGRIGDGRARRGAAWTRGRRARHHRRCRVAPRRRARAGRRRARAETARCASGPSASGAGSSRWSCSDC